MWKDACVGCGLYRAYSKSIIDACMACDICIVDLCLAGVM